MTIAGQSRSPMLRCNRSRSRDRSRSVSGFMSPADLASVRSRSVPACPFPVAELHIDELDAYLVGLVSKTLQAEGDIASLLAHRTAVRLVVNDGAVKLPELLEELLGSRDGSLQADVHESPPE
jgi:hypothetical protein